MKSNLKSIPQKDSIDNKWTKLNKVLWPYTRSLLVAFLTLILTPISLQHFCDAGCREMDFVIGSPLVTFAYLYSFYGRLPKKKWKTILLLVIWLLIVFGITDLYFDWIHGQNSPWPSTMHQME